MVRRRLVQIGARGMSVLGKERVVVAHAHDPVAGSGLRGAIRDAAPKFGHRADLTDGRAVQVEMDRVDARPREVAVCVDEAGEERASLQRNDSRAHTLGPGPQLGFASDGLDAVAVRSQGRNDPPFGVHRDNGAPDVEHRAGRGWRDEEVVGCSHRAQQRER